MLKKLPALALCCALLTAACPALADTPTKPADGKAPGKRIRATAHRLISDAKEETALPNIGAQAPTRPHANHLSKETKIAVGVAVAVAVVVAIVVAAKANDGRGARCLAVEVCP